MGAMVERTATGEELGGGCCCTTVAAACSMARKAAMPAEGIGMGVAGSECADLVTMALPRVRGLAAASECACCLSALASDLLLAGALPPSAGVFAAVASDLLHSTLHMAT